MSTLLARLILVMLAIFMLVQLALLSGLWWLHTKPGQNFLEAQLNEAMAGSGYHLEFAGLGYRPFNGIAVKTAALTDDTGMRISIDGLTLRTGLMPLLNKTLLLGARVDRVTVTQVPGSVPAVNINEPFASFTLPDIYLKSIVLKSISVGEFISDGSVLAKDMAIKGRLDLDGKIYTKLDIALPDIALGTIEGSFDPQQLLASIDALAFSGMGVDVAGHGSAGFAENGLIDMVLTVTATDLSTLSESLEGHADLTATVTGKSLSPDFAATGVAEMTGPRGKDIAPIALKITAKDFINHMIADIVATTSYQKRPVKTVLQVEQKDATLSFQKMSVTLPGIKASGSGVYNTDTANMNGQVKMVLTDLSVYLPDVPPEYRPHGAASVSFKNHDINLKSNLRFAGRNITVNSGATLLPNQSRIVIRNFRMTDGGTGFAEAAGQYDYGDKMAALIKANLRKFRLPLEGPLQGIVSGQLNLSQNGNDIKVAGRIDPDRIDITIPEKFNSTIPTLNVIRPGQKSVSAPDFLQSIDTDITIHAPKRVFVRGWGLDAEFGGTVAVSGALNDPQVNGSFSSLRGRFEEFGKRFTIDHADLRFQGSVPPSPYLDIKAVITTDGIEAAVLLTGSAAKPEIGFSSVPALPKDEVLAHILFGRDMKRLSPFEAVQLADTLRRLSGQGSSSSFNPLNAFRNAIGLDDLRVDQDESGQTTVGAGKYISDKVYIELKKGAGSETGAASVNIDVTRNIKVESEVGDSRGAGGGVSWQWDY